MSDLTQTISAGTILAVSRGCYSDYGFDGVVRVVKPFVKQDVCDEYRRQWKPPYEGYWKDEADAEGFLPWLVKEGFVEALDNFLEWHIGEYSEFNP